MRRDVAPTGADELGVVRVQGGEAHRELVEMVNRLISERRTDKSKLARQLRYSRKAIQQVANGHGLPSPTLAALLDQALQAGGRIVRLRDQAHAEKQAGRLRELAATARPTAGALASIGRTVVISGTNARDVVPTDRRTALAGAVALGLGGLAEVAGARSRAIAAANADRASVTGLELAFSKIARSVRVSDPAAIIPAAFKVWDDAERILEGRVHPDAITRVTLVAGQTACRLGHIGRYLGDEEMARWFANIASQHADATRRTDPALVGTVAALETWISMDAGQHAAAADIAARGYADAVPEQRARLAAYEAMAASAARLTVQTDRAIEAMRAGMRTAAIGTHAWNDAEEDLYLAIACGNVGGRGQLAVVHGERAIRTFVDDHDGVSRAHCAVALGYLDGDRPKPDAAASAALGALDVLAVAPRVDVEATVRNVARKLDPWRDLEPLVTDLGNRLGRAA